MKCKICSNSNFKIIYQEKLPKNIQSDDFNITDSNYSYHSRIVSCTKCNFIFANPQPSKNDLDNFYSNLNDEEYQNEKKGRSINFNRILERLNLFFKQPGQLLDIGCASGLFLNEAKKRGWKVAGIDPSKWAKHEAKKNYNIDISNKDVLEYQSFKKFDVITLLDVIEHVPNPIELLKKCNTLLKEDGILVIVTPNIQSKISKLLKENWWHIRIAHIYYFDPKNLEKSLEKSNFIPLLKKTYQWNFSFNYWHSRFKGVNNRFYKFSFKLLHLIPYFDKFIGNKIISFDFKDSFEWYCAKKQRDYTKYNPIPDFVWTSFYLGKFPWIPATFTSSIYALLNIIILTHFTDLFYTINLIVLLLSIILSVIFEKSAEKQYQTKDPRPFTIDELAGLSFVFIFLQEPSIAYIFLGFFLFRFFDISKIGMIKSIEKLPIRGTIVWDDLIAGLYAVIIVTIIFLTRTLLIV